MIILGIHDGHNSSAALVIDGKLICSLSEERFSRIKNHFGYPKKVNAALNYRVKLNKLIKLHYHQKILNQHIFMYLEIPSFQ